VQLNSQTAQAASQPQQRASQRIQPAQLACATSRGNLPVRQPAQPEAIAPRLQAFASSPRSLRAISTANQKAASQRSSPARQPANAATQHASLPANQPTQPANRPEQSAN